MTWAEKILAEAGRIDAEKDKIKSVYDAGYEQGKTDCGVEIIRGTVTPASDTNGIIINTNKGKRPKVASIYAIENFQYGIKDISAIARYKISSQYPSYRAAFGTITYASGGQYVGFWNKIGTFTMELNLDYVRFGSSLNAGTNFVAGTTFAYELVYYNDSEGDI